MADKKVEVPLRGKMVQGTELSFKLVKEEWNVYEADDGTTLKLKSVVSRIVRLDEYKEDGEPIYWTRSQNVMAALVPEKLKKKKEDKDESSTDS